MKSIRTSAGSDHGGLRALPTKEWRCDSCGKWMDQRQAHVTWNAVGRTFKGHRIVHDTPTCRAFNDQHVFALDELVGADGLAMLLSWIASRRHNVRGVVELIRRIHVSRFESIAPWFNERYHPNLVDHDPRRDMLFQEELETIRQRLQDEGWPQPRKAGPFLRPGAQYAIRKLQLKRAHP